MQTAIITLRTIKFEWMLDTLTRDKFRRGRWQTCPSIFKMAPSFGKHGAFIYCKDIGSCDSGSSFLHFLVKMALVVCQLTISLINLYVHLHVLCIWAASWQNQQSECAPSKDSDQPGLPHSLIRAFAVHMKKAWTLSYPMSAQWRLIRLGGCPGWSESLLGAQPHCWFCHEAAHIILCISLADTDTLSVSHGNKPGALLHLLLTLINGKYSKNNANLYKWSYVVVSESVIMSCIINDNLWMD